jgi:hypothetical protein
MLKPPLRFGVLFAEAEQHADPPHSLRLLRARSKRPCSRRTTEEPDEFAPLHVPP